MKRIRYVVDGQNDGLGLERGGIAVIDGVIVEVTTRNRGIISTVQRSPSDTLRYIRENGLEHAVLNSKQR